MEDLRCSTNKAGTGRARTNSCGLLSRVEAPGAQEEGFWDLLSFPLKTKIWRIWPFPGSG